MVFTSSFAVLGVVGLLLLLLAEPSSSFSRLSSSSPAASSSSASWPKRHHHNHHHHNRRRRRRCGARTSSALPSSASSSSSAAAALSSSPELPMPMPLLFSSAYDRNLPPALVGEAVRSALRSDRGTCFDFSWDRYYDGNDGDGDDDDSRGGRRRRLVSVVGMRGEGALSFVDAKFAAAAPPRKRTQHRRIRRRRLSPSTELVRTGRAFETAYLTPKGRAIDRLLVLAFGEDNDDDDDDEEAMMMEDAFLITSPGNGGATLYRELSPLVFPMDKVELSDYSSSSSSSSEGGGSRSSTGDGDGDGVVIALACSSLKDARMSFENNVLGLLLTGGNSGGMAKEEEGGSSFDFPEAGECHHYRVVSSSSSPSGTGEMTTTTTTTTTTTDVYLTEHTFLSPEICRGYSLLFREREEEGETGSSSTLPLSDRIWDNLVDERNDVGPVGMGMREYETLRIEAGVPGYGCEMTGDGPKRKKKKQGNGKTIAKDDGEDVAVVEVSGDGDVDDGMTYHAKAGPLELHMQSLVDTEKGCYQGQEGVASVLKNKRGPPRQLYQVVFLDSENDFDDGDSGSGGRGGGGGFGLVSVDTDELREFRRRRKGADPIPNDTRQPRPGDDLYVLGSSESIHVGTITSVAEPNGTGDPKTIALALIKRPGPILNAIKERDLDLPRWWEDAEDDDGGDGDGGRRGDGGTSSSSGIMRPPPLDPLHNLEIVMGGTYTVGRLASVPSRRYRPRRRRGSGEGDVDEVAALLDYENSGDVVDAGGDAPAYFRYEFPEGMNHEDGADATGVGLGDKVATTTAEVEDVDNRMKDGEISDQALAEAEEEAAKAAAEAEAAAAEARRKEDKMKLLKARAEAAMAARRKKKDLK